MKLINYSLIALSLILVILFRSELHLAQNRKNVENSFYLQRVCQAASKSAVEELRLALLKGYGQKNLITSEGAEIAVNSFFKSLAYSFSADDQNAKQHLADYVAFIVVGDSQGYYIYSNFENDSYHKTPLPKIRFCQEFDDNYFYFDGDKIAQLDKTQAEITLNYWSIEQWQKRKLTPQFAELILASNHQQRIAVLKRQQLADDINYYSNLAPNNQNTDQRYHLQLEHLAEDKLDFKHPFFLVAVEGFPLTAGQHFSQLFSSQYNLVYSQNYAGFTEAGIKYYLPSNSPAVQQKTVDVYFGNAIEAAQAGYYPYD